MLAGFFLTAVPNWTGAPASRAGFVSAIAVLWLAGRACVFFSAELPALLVGAVDLIFILVLSLKILSNLLKRPKPQNMMFLVLLGLMLAGNVLVHLEWSGVTQNTAAAGLSGGLFTLAAMIAVLGGRVTPAFTRNAMRQAGRETGLPRSYGWLDGAGIASAIALALLVLVDVGAQVLAGVALFAALANAARLSGWSTRSVLDSPILWSLHLGFAMLALGYAAVGLHWAGMGIGYAAALHILGIGSIGGMTLAVMSRAALGHTGRPLKVAPQIAAAYLLMAMAALVRSLGIMAFPQAYYPLMFAAGGLWIGAFAIFAIWYAPILTAARIDRAG